MDLKLVVSVSYYSAIGDTISCNAPYSAIGFRGKLVLQYPPRYHRKHSVTGVLLNLSCDRGVFWSGH